MSLRIACQRGSHRLGVIPFVFPQEMFQMLLPKFGKIAGDVPCAARSTETGLSLLGCLIKPNKVPGKFLDRLRESAFWRARGGWRIGPMLLCFMLWVPRAFAIIDEESRDWNGHAELRL